MSRGTDMHGFLPDDYIELKTQRRTNLLWALVFLVVAGGIGWAYFIAQDKIRKAEAANYEANQDFAAAAEPIQQFKRLQAEQARLNEKAELVGSLIERVNRSNILAVLTNSLPPRVFLTDLDLSGKPRVSAAATMTKYERAKANAAKTSADKAAQKPGAAAAGEPAEPVLFDVIIKVTGLAMSDRQVADYMTNLQRSPLFKEVNFVMAREFIYQDRPLREFELQLQLDPMADSRKPELQASAETPAAKAVANSGEEK